MKLLSILLLIGLSTIASAYEIIEDFEGQTIGVRCTPFWVNQFDISVTDIKASSGSKSCKFKVLLSQTGWGGGITIPSQAIGSETWVRFRIFMPTGFDYRTGYDDGLLKFVRIDQEQPGGIQGRFDWLWADPAFQANAFWQGVEGVPCTTNCFYKFGGTNNPTHGVWETWEVYAKWSYTSQDTGGEGRALFWKNGILMGERTDFPTVYSLADEINGVRFFDHWNGGSRQVQELYIDDIVITDTTPGDVDAVGNPFIGLTYPFTPAPTTCTGGSGSDYGSMICSDPICDISSDPSLGCLGAAPPIPPTPPSGALQAHICYLSGMNYWARVCTLNDTLGTTACYPTSPTGFSNFCGTTPPPTGYASPAVGTTAFDDSGTPLDCRQADTLWVTNFCNINW